MGFLRKHDVELMRRGLEQRERARRPLPFVVFAFVALALLVLSRLDHSALREVRWRLTEFLSPALELMSGPLEPVRRQIGKLRLALEGAEELERLRAENWRLKEVEQRAADAERQLEGLKELSNAVHEPAIRYITARMVASGTGPFARGVLVNVGRDQNVRVGYPALNAGGLVGRVVETGSRVSQVLLLTDVNSKIPVVIGAGSVRAVMAGDNTSLGRVMHLAEGRAIQAGDEVVTSGVGGLFPRGLRIGRVVSSPKGLRISPHADLDAIEHLRVLFYDSPASDLIESTGQPSERRQARSGESGFLPRPSPERVRP